MNNIPIKNIYYIVLYAFDGIKNKKTFSPKNLEKEDSFSDLIIKIFNHEVEKLIKYGLYQNYNEIEEETAFIKGKINFKETIKRIDNKAVCEFDEFNTKDNCNKIIKYTLNKLLFAKDVNEKIKKRLKTNYYYFERVPLEEFSFIEIKQYDLNKLNQHYELALKLALFLNYELIPKNKKGNFDFIHIFENEEVMNQLYEKFLYNFYKINLDNNQFKVKSGSKFDWELKKLHEEKTMLPQMMTDIEIRNNDNNSLIVIDAKYYKNAFSDRFGVEKHQSANMYQMNAYLDYYMGKYQSLRGILLYPSNGYEFHHKYEKVNAYKIEFATVDLNKDWKEIEENLFSIID